MSLREMKNDKKKMVLAKQGILDSAVNEVRALTATEMDEVKDYDAKIKDLTNKIKEAEKRELENVSFSIEDSREVAAENIAIDNEVENFIKTGLRGTELRAFNADQLNGTATATMGTIIPTHIADFIIEKMTENSNAFAEATHFQSVTGQYQITSDAEGEDEAMIIAEGTDFTDWKKLSFTGKTLDQLRFVAGYVLTQQLINNSQFDLISYATVKLAKKMAKKAEEQIFKGAGTDSAHNKQFRGLDANVNLATVNAQNLNGGQLLDKLNLAVNTINPTFLGGSKWYMSREIYNAIALLKDANGHFYVQNGVVNGKLTQTLFGYPIAISEMLSAKYPVYFGSMKDAYAIMIKKGMNLQHIYADTQNAIQGTHVLLLDMYMDGCVLDEQAIVRVQRQA